MTTSTPPDALPASKEAEEVAKPIGYMREKDNDGTAFWVSKAKNSYYGKPLYAHPPTDAGVSEAMAGAILQELAHDTRILIMGSDPRSALRVALSTAIPAGDGVPPGMVLITECASDGCHKQATVRFERGGVGSYYCHDCYMRIQAIPTSTAGKG